MEVPKAFAYTSAAVAKLYIDCESIYSLSSAVKQTSETLNKFIYYLCFIVVDENK